MNDTTQDESDSIKTTTHKKPSLSKKTKIALVALSALVLSALSYIGYVYAASPAVIRSPLQEHYHFRMQIVVDGKSENFAEDKYQQEYAKNQCSAELTKQPIHFHDQKNQFVHIHWEAMTGGMVLKYYGWNYIGGINGALGYKIDDLSNIRKVAVYGNLLPKLAQQSQLYVYSGDESTYKERSLDEFVTQDLEQFFGTTSNSPAHEENKSMKSSFDNVLFPKVSANGGINPGSNGTPGEESQQEKLTRINNNIGNVVIFSQKDKPTNQQIKERFDKLTPLSDSSCGG